MSTETRQDIEALLPFYVNGTLDQDERARVDAALADDTSLAAQARALSALRDQMKAEDIDYSPGDFGLARLTREIDAETVQPAQSRAGFLGGFALAAALALAAFLSVTRLMTPPEPVYEQASGDAAALSVIFQPDVTQEQMTELMLELGLVIVDGPSALGIYRVAPLDERDLTALASSLRAADDVIDRVDVPQ